MIVASLVAVALPTAADAKRKKPKKPYTDATFEVSIKGSMASTWEYHRPNDKDDPCDASANGNGSQLLRFDAGGPYRVTFRKPPKDDPNLYGTDGRPFVFVQGSGLINALSTAEREGDVTVNYGEIGPPELCGDNGGADPGYVPTPKDCGTREGIMGLDLYFKEQYVDDDDLFVPLPTDKQDGQPNRLRLNDTATKWTNPHGGPAGDLGGTYENCDFYGEYPENAGTLYITSGKLSEKQLFNRKRKRFVVSGDAKRTKTSGYTKTDTIMAWNVRMKRVK
jgi:hypothetical protein